VRDLFEATYPFNTANFVIVTTGQKKLAFSYATLIGFYHPTTGWVARDNEWGPTTGKHLNYLPPNPGERLKGSQFEQMAERFLLRRLPTGEHV
jgi:hypothetical protein